VGPSAIAARRNPYGAATADNPGNNRVCLGDMDPRQRGLYGAAWNVGYVAAFAAGGLNAVTLGAATGPAGIIYRKLGFPQPHFDGAGGAPVFPVYHVIAGLAGASGSKLVSAKSAAPGKVAALAYRAKEGPVLWLANLTGEAQKAKVSGFNGKATLHLIDEGSFVAATDASFLAKGGKALKKVGALALPPYAVARVAAAG
jgi:hypothetical protein